MIKALEKVGSLYVQFRVFYLVVGPPFNSKGWYKQHMPLEKGTKFWPWKKRDTRGPTV